MKQAIYMKMVPLSLLILTLLGCASTPPAELITQIPANDINLSEVNQAPSRFIGSPVRWGGRIVKTEERSSDETIQESASQSVNHSSAVDTPKANKDESKRFLRVEILAYPLDQNGKPVQSAEALGGRFIARLQPPYKAGRYYRNRWVTVAGDIVGVDSYSLANGGSQTLPVIESQAKYAWREEYRDDYYDDYWWPRFYFRYGIGHRDRGSRSGVGIIFKPLRFP